MSRNKPRGGTRAVPAKPLSRRINFKWVVLILLGLGIGSYMLFLVSCNQGAVACYTQARALLERDPDQCERLAEQAIITAVGSYPEAQLLRSRAFAAMGQWDEALGVWSLIGNSERCQTEDLTAFGEAALGASQWKFADEVLRVAVAKRDQSGGRARELLIKLELRFDRKEDALRLCEEWQKFDPAAPIPWMMAGDIHMTGMRLGNALDDYRQVLQRSPSPELERDARGSLAQLLVVIGDREARKEFDRLSAKAPLTGKLQLSHVQLLRMEGRTEEALAEINRYISQSGSSAEALKLNGMLLLDLDRTNEALVDLQKAVQVNQFDIIAQHKLGEAYQRSGDPMAAQPHLDAARKMTEATYRISEVEDLLRQDPSNNKLQKELAGLRAILGR